MAEDTSRLRIVVDPSGAKQGAEEAERALAGVQQAAAATVQSTDAIGARFRTMAGEVDAGAQAAAAAAARGGSAVVHALELSLRERQGQIQKALEGGLISQDEADRAGREAGRAFASGMARAYKQGAVQLDASGLLQAGGQTFTAFDGQLRSVSDYAKKVGEVGAVSRASGAGVGALKESVASLASQMAGAHPITGRLVSVLGSMALGSAMTVGILAGLAAIAYAWREVAEDTRRAREETESAIARASELARTQALGPNASRVADEATLESNVRQAQSRLSRAQRAYDVAGAGAPGDEQAAALAEAAALRQLQKAQNEYTEAYRQLSAVRIDLASKEMDQVDKTVQAEKKATEERERAQKEATEKATRAEQERKRALSELATAAASAWKVEELRTEALSAAAEAERRIQRELERSNLTLEEKLRLLTLLGNVQDVIAASAALATDAPDPGPARLANLGGYRTISSVQPLLRREVEEASGAMNAIWAETIRGVQQTTASGIRGMLDGSLEDWSDYGDAVVDLMAGVAAQIATALAADALGLDDLLQKIQDKEFSVHSLTKTQAGVGAGLAGFGIGYGTRSPLAGAAGGALAGSALLPGIGTAVGALAGLAGGILGAGQAAEEAAQQHAQLSRSLKLSLESMRADLYGSDLDRELARLKDVQNSLREQARAVYEAAGGGHDNPAFRAFMEAMREIGRLYEEATRRARESAEAERQRQEAEAEAQKARVTAATNAAKEDAALQILRLRGDDEQAERWALEIQQRRRVIDVQDEGLLRLYEVLAAEEDLALAREQAARAAEEEARRQLGKIAFDDDLGVRRARLGGDPMQIATAEWQARATAQLAAANQQFAAGDITLEQLIALSDLLNDELAAALREVADAAEAATAAAEREAQRAYEDLEVEDLSLRGLDSEARRRELELRNEREREAAVEAGRSQDYLDLLDRVQRQRMENLARDLAGGAGGGSGMAERAATAAGDTFKGVQIISETTGVRMVDVLLGIQTNTYNTAVGVARLAGDGVALLPAMGVGGRPIGGGTQVVIQVALPNALILSAQDATRLGDRLGRALAPALNRELAALVEREDRHAGQALV